MSTLKVNNLQVGQDATATNNFTLYQPASPDGTVRLGVGNSGSVTDILTLNSSSYIGFGITNPSHRFHFVSPAGAQPIFQVGQSGISNGYTLTSDGTFLKHDFYNDTGVSVSFYQNKVGIGISTPYKKLTLRGTNEPQILLDLNSATNGDYSSIAWNGSTGDLGLAGGYTAEIRGYRAAAGAYGDLTFHTRDGSASSNEVVRITSTRNVGIGTNNPSAKLDLRGTLSVSTSIVNVLRGDTTYPTISIRDNATASDAVGDVLISGYYPIVFNTDLGFERMRIARNGNVGIGTTDPQNKLHVYTTSGNNGIVVENTSTANIAITGVKNGEATVQLGQFGSTASGTTFGLTNSNLSFIYTTSYGTTHPSALAIGNVSNIPVVIATNSTERFRIDGNGNLTINTPTTTTNKLVGFTNLSGTTGWTVGNGVIASAEQFVLYSNTSGQSRLLVDSNGNTGIGTTIPTEKLHVLGNIFANTGNVNANYKFMKGNGNYLSRAFTYHNYKTGWSNGAWVGHYRFTRTFSQANNGLIGVIGGMLHIVYVNERTNTVQTSGYDSFPIIIRMRSNDTVQVGIGTAIADVQTVIGSLVEVRSANATDLSVDIEIRVWNSDGADGENFCHSWIDFGGAASHSNQFPEITLL